MDISCFGDMQIDGYGTDKLNLLKLCKGVSKVLSPIQTAPLMD